MPILFEMVNKTESSNKVAKKRNGRRIAKARIKVCAGKTDIFDNPTK